jgi:hypothetical protein
MAVPFQDIQTVIDLRYSVKSDGTRPLENILIAQVAPWHTRLIWTEIAIVLTTELVWRKTHAHIQDTTRTANGLQDEGTIEGFIIGNGF